MPPPDPDHAAAPPGRPGRLASRHECQPGEGRSAYFLDFSGRAVVTPAGQAGTRPLAGIPSHESCGGPSRCRAAAWPQAGQPAPEEEIIVTAGTPQAGPAPPAHARLVRAVPMI